MDALDIFKPGRHTDMAGQTLAFSEADVRAIAESYDAALHEAPVVVGHPAADGPAYGWVRGLAYQGGTLRAELHQVEPQFADMVSAGRFKKRSAAFYGPDYPQNPKPGGWYLRHVGFLGAQPPAVKGLKDPAFADDGEGLVVVAFGEWEDRALPRLLRGLRDFLIGKFTQEEADRALPTYEIELLEQRAAESRPSFAEPASPPVPKQPEPDGMKPEELKAKETELATKEAAFAEKDKEIQAREEALARKEAERHRADCAAFVEGLVKDGKVRPAQQEGVTAFLAALPTGLDTAKAVAFGEADKRTEQSPLEFAKGYLAAQPKLVELGESAAGDDTELPGDDPVEIARQATAYAEEMRGKGLTVSMTEAVNHVTKGSKGA